MDQWDLQYKGGSNTFYVRESKAARVRWEDSQAARGWRGAQMQEPDQVWTPAPPRTGWWAGASLTYVYLSTS